MRKPRLSRYQQLTLTTWRYASTRIERILDPSAVLEQTAVHIVLATLREVTEAMELFGRHATAEPEFALVKSLVDETDDRGLPFDLLDTAFLARWRELTADGCGPEELPPLRPRPWAASTPDV
jgi:hypothetical protein